MEIKSMFKLTNAGKLKATFTVDTPKVEFRNFKLLENDKGELWASPPTESYVDKKTNEKKWTYHYRFKDRVLLDKITDLAKQEYFKDTKEIDEVPF